MPTTVEEVEFEDAEDAEEEVAGPVLVEAEVGEGDAPEVVE
jgi:hypothetical protein